MLEYFFRFLSSLASFAFPVFASYKALHTDDITLIKPWLMYWVIIAIQLTAESYFGIVLSVIPFYQFFRFLFMLWLVLPQSQGASQLYITYVQPFLQKHESEIDNFITQSHINAKKIGVEYVARGSHFIKEYLSSLLFGSEMKPYESKRIVDEHVDSIDEQASFGISTGLATSYSDVLFSRFRYPPMSTKANGHGSEEYYSSLGALLAKGNPATIISSLYGAASSSRLFSIPSGLKSKDEKLSYLSQQRANLLQLISSLDERTKAIENDKEYAESESESTTTLTGLNSKTSRASIVSESSSTSDAEFDVVKAEEADDEEREESIKAEESRPSKGWFGWSS